MSSRHVTFDTVTVGLGEDAGAPDALSMTPPPVLARTPRVKGIRRFDPAGAAPAAEPAEVGIFQVTAGVEVGVTPASRPPARELRVDRPEVADEPIIQSEPKPAATPFAEAQPQDWATALLRWQSGGATTSRLLLAFLLAAMAGASLVLLRPARDTHSPTEAPEWTPAPLADAAPLFVPAPTQETTVTQMPAPAVNEPMTPGAPVAVAVGPSGIARQRAVQNKAPQESAPPPVAERVASLPAPYPNTGARPTDPQAIGPGPAAHLIGIRPADSPSPTQLR